MRKLPGEILAEERETEIRKGGEEKRLAAGWLVVVMPLKFGNGKGRDLPCPSLLTGLTGAAMSDRDGGRIFAIC